MGDFFDPPIDEIHVFAVSAATLRQAENLIEGCEFCHPDDAEIPFDWILDRVTGRLGSTTDYILTERARCSNCKMEITEKALVRPKHD
jgi:hypothetical protein